DGMAHDVEHQLLKFLNLCSDPVPRFPPSVGIERGVARTANNDSRVVTVHETMKHSPKTSRVICEHLLWRTHCYSASTGRHEFHQNYYPRRSPRSAREN